MKRALLPERSREEKVRSKEEGRVTTPKKFVANFSSYKANKGGRSLLCFCRLRQNLAKEAKKPLSSSSSSFSVTSAPLPHLFFASPLFATSSLAADFSLCPRYNTSAVVQNEVREGGERDPDFAKSERNSREGRGESRKTILLRARKTISRRVSIFFLCLLFWEGLVMVAAPIRQPGSSRSGVWRNERLVTHYKSEGENAEV